MKKLKIVFVMTLLITMTSCKAENEEISIVSNNQNNETILDRSGDTYPVYDIKGNDIKPVEPLDSTKYSGCVTISPESLISIETTISVNSKPANAEKVNNYSEQKSDVFDYTYDIVDGCWKFTKTMEKDYYFYSVYEDSLDSSSNQPKMKRYFRSGDTFQAEYLDTEDWFYAPYEDEEGNIYAECGRYSEVGYSEHEDIYICLMDLYGKTISKLRISDLLDKNSSYQNFFLIKKNIVAIVFKLETENSNQRTQLQIIDMSQNEIICKINLEDELNVNHKSDGEHFILTSSSYQWVYVFDADTYQLVNTVDTTKCKELCTYEFNFYDDENGVYDSMSYQVDIKDGKIYFLRHSGVYVTDCMKPDFYKLLDGGLYPVFQNQLNSFTDFFIGDGEDIYILGVYFDEESATTEWQYKRIE